MGENAKHDRDSPEISLHDTGRSPLPRCEDYKVDLDGVWTLQLVIDADIARGAVGRILRTEPFFDFMRNLKMIVASILAILVAIIVIQNREPVTNPFALSYGRHASRSSAFHHCRRRIRPWSSSQTKHKAQANPLWRKVSIARARPMAPATPTRFKRSI